MPPNLDYQSLSPSHSGFPPYLVSFVATNTTGLGASAGFSFCRLAAGCVLERIPEARGLPLAEKGTPAPAIWKRMGQHNQSVASLRLLSETKAHPIQLSQPPVNLQSHRSVSP